MEAEALRYQFDTVEVHPAAFSILRDGKPLDLEPKAVRVLLFLIENRHRAVTKEEIFNAVWGDTAVTDNALTRIIAQLRRELGDDARQSRYIQTLPTTGYRFIADLRQITTEPAPATPPSTPTPSPRFPTKRVAFAAISIIALFGAAYFFATRTRSSAVRPVQLTTSPSLDITPSFSPDGQRFVYSSDRPGRFELFLRSLSGAGPDLQVTNDGKQNIEPVWSPDGKWLAYHSVAEHGIWMIPATGGVPKRLTQFGSQPSWSPDSRQIVFRSVEPMSLAWFDVGGTAASTIWTVAADGSQQRQLTTLGAPFGTHAMPSFSPDGKRVLFIALSPLSAVYELDIASGKPSLILQVGRELPRRPGTWWTRVWDPRYGPGGKGIYFSAINPRGDYSIYFQSHPGGTPVEIYSAQVEVPTGIALSPDSRKMLLTRLASVSQLWSLTPGAEPKPFLQESVLRAYLPSFSPDGKFLSLMVETAGRNRDLWLLDTATGQASPVTTDPGPKEGGTAWGLRDGALHYVYINENQIEFRRFDVKTRAGSVFHHWTASTEFFHPSLMPNERDVLTACSRPLNVCIVPAKGGPSRQLTFETTGATYPTADREGEWIAFEVRRGADTQIGIVDRNGGHFEILTSQPGVHWPYSFSGDSRRVAYSAFEQGVWNLWTIDRLTRERKQLTTNTSFGTFVRSPTWRPNSEQLVYEHWQAKGNIHLIQLPE